MKFIVSSSSLSKHLQQISGVINSNTVLPILEDFLFMVETNELTVVATDLETVMRVTLEVEARETGRVCIPARILVDSLKNITEQPLTFSIDANSFAIEITSDNGKYKISGENPENFPKEPTADHTTSLTIPSLALLTGISKTIFAASTDELRAAMTGIYFELAADQILFVTTDAHRLVKYIRTDVVCPKPENFIVPRKPLNLLKSLLPADDSPVKLSYSSNYLFIAHGRSSMSCRLIEARFPDYKVVMPSDNPYKLTLNKSDFLYALRRVSVFANKSTNQVAMSIVGSELQLTSQDMDLSFEGNERMKCHYTGEDMQLAFNARFLIEMLGAIDGEEVVMELSTPSRAALLKPVEKQANEELTMLVMPLMLNP
ncbi:MAG TPA: DNA polymerase III subunit beta [Chitinophagaceae bacterium]|nr:DNA polymerase III subunit beta [Chitinophagaceae bacterium]